ncbi:MAG TPA: PAS domain S-box protein, partial [Burkholderiales bacterium]|nr:PAS domain S-box protein [Burkholderiales bacterium]
MALSLPQQRLRRALSCVFVLAVVLVSGAWLLALERVAYEESEARRQAFRETGNLALAFEQDLVGTLEALRQALFFTEHEFAQKGRGVDFASVFAMLALDHSPFTTLAIVDEHGRVLTSTGIANVDVSDREYFRFHAASPSSALHVGEPIDGRLSGRPTIPVSRRIDKLDGSFGGLVLAGVTPAYFTDFFRRIDLGRGGLIQIVGLDGVVRARQVGGVTSWGGDLLESNLAEHAGSAPSGSFVSAGRLDGVQRFMSYRRVPGAPLLISVGVPVEEAMAPFGVRRESYLRGAAAASLLVLLFAGVLALVLRRQARMAEGRRQDAERLEQVRGRLLELVDNTNDFIWETNGELALVYASSNVVKLLGYTAAQMLGKTPMEFLPPAERERVAAWFAPVLAARRPYANLVTQVMHKDGGTRFWESSAAPILDAAGALSGYRGVSRDVTERKRAEQALAESEARFRDLADNTSDFIWELDAQMRFTYASGSLKTLLGQAPESLLGHMPVEFMPPEDATRVGRAMKDLAREKKGFASLEHGVRDAEGRLHVWEVSGVPILGLDGELRGYRGVSRDITERKRAEERLEREAHYDRVTGLPNRALCFDRLSQAIVHAQRHGTFTGVLLVDLDRFKAINDTLGHATGDAVLRAAAERLGACVRAGDTVARIGGDEF